MGVLLLCLLAGTSALSDLEIEAFLQNAKIVNERVLAEGTTKSVRATLSDGKTTHDAQIQPLDFFKPIYKLKTGVEKNFRDSYKFNIAAYRFSRLLGLDNVPVSIERIYKGKPSSFTWWLEDVQMDEFTRRSKKIEPPDPNHWTELLDDVKVFDQLIANIDRNQGNLLIGNDWKLWMIDHTRAFREEGHLRRPDVLRRISEKLLNALRKLDRAAVSARLEPFITPAGVDALMARRDLIVRYFDQQIAARGRDAILTGINRGEVRATIP